MEQLTFHVPKMDCAAEEQLVRLHLGNQTTVKHLTFDLPARTVVVTHNGDQAEIEQAMQSLNLGASLTNHTTVEEEALDLDASDAQQRRLLIVVLLINFGLFAIELMTGFLAGSMGLVADSLDMLADALVYGLSLYAVGKAVTQKKRVAAISGYFQIALALFGLVEVVRRFLGSAEEPGFGLMIGISLLAFVGNVASLLILQRARRDDANMKASWIFTSNDVVVNLSVMVAGLLVFVTRSPLPDLVVGAVVFGVVAYGAYRILRLSR